MTESLNSLGQAIGTPVPGWQPRPFPPHSALQGRHAWLEPLDPERHGPALFDAYAKDVAGRLWTYLAYGPFASYADFHAHLLKFAASRDPQFYAVVELTSGVACGVASYLRIEPATGVIEVGHINYAPALQRTPAATETMFLMMSRVFDELGYRRYEWKCDALNAASRRAALRLGFSFEGIFRQATLYKGRNRDTAWFSMIDAEWPARKRAFEAWLDPTNFDAQGQQRQGLVAFMTRVQSG